MTYKIGTAIPIKYFHGETGQTINYRVMDEANAVFATGTLTEHASVTGYYEGSFTPDAAGMWAVMLYYSVVKIAQLFYDVGGGLTTQEKADVNAEVDSALNTAIPGSPTADSANERIKTLDDAYTAARAAYLDKLLAGDVGASHDVTTANDTSETQMFEVAKATRYALAVYVDLATLVTAGEGSTVTVRLYNKIDETNYRLVSKSIFLVGTDDVHPSFAAEMVNHYCKVTIQCSGNVTATRAVPYRYLTRDLE